MRIRKPRIKTGPKKYLHVPFPPCACGCGLLCKDRRQQCATRECVQRLKAKPIREAVPKPLRDEQAYLHELETNPEFAQLEAERIRSWRVFGRPAPDYLKIWGAKPTKTVKEK